MEKNIEHKFNNKNVANKAKKQQYNENETNINKIKNKQSLNGEIKKPTKKIISSDINDISNRTAKKQNEIRDTSGDTKVFQVIRREDIERERRRQAIEKENDNLNTIKKENNISSKRKENAVSSKKRENAISIEEKENAVSSKRKENNISSKGKENSVSGKRKEDIKEKNNNTIDYNKTSNNEVDANLNKVTTNQILKNTSNKNIVNNIKTTNVVLASNKTLASSKTLASNKTLEKNPDKYNNYQERNKTTKLNDYESKHKSKNKSLKESKKENKKANIKENKSENNKEEKNESKNQNILKVILLIIIFILIIIICSTIFGAINMNSNTIINGIKANNINISNLTQEEAIKNLNEVLNNNETNVITIKRNNYEKQIYLEDVKGKFDVESAVSMAYNIGREKDIVSNNYKTIETLIQGSNLNVSFSYDEGLLEEKINEISLDLPDLAIASSYIINGNKLIIKNSIDGIQIQKESFKQNLINAFSNSQKEFELPVEQVEKKEIDIQKIHDEIYKKPVNAYYTTNPYKIYKEEYGLDFAITVEEATKMLQENKAEYEIELKEIKPQITVLDLGDAAFPETLSTFTTTYGTADVNRNANIALAAKSINSVVLMPGEVFSYNDLIGECSTRTGYKTSTIYLNGQLSTGVGGGICQVSTTLYNTVLRANLEIVQRRNHSMGVTYVPAGQDAMVNIGTSDFKFKNNREYPIKVIAYVNPGSVTCAIKGLKQETEYEVKLESRTIEKTDVRYKVETFKVLYLNGNVVSRTWLSTDTYKYH